MYDGSGSITARMGDDARTWAVVTEASALSAVAVLPYLLGLQGAALDAANARRVAQGKRPVTTPTLAGLTYLQGHVMFGAAAGLGLRLGAPLGLGLPRLAARLHGRPLGLRPSHAAAYAAAGAGAALAVAALDRTLFAGARTELAQAGVREPGIWQGALASAYGAIAEEVLVRLGLQTSLVAGLRRVRGETATPPGAATVWPAIALASLAFGAGHLPAVRAIARLTPATVARTLALNAVPGAVFGYLYWKRGLEAAMIAHGAADLVLHVGGALLQGDGETSG